MIGYDAFSESSLTSIDIPSSIHAIDDGAFDNCHQRFIKLRRLHFFGCYRVKTFEFEGTVAQWNENDVDKNWCDTSSIKEVICKDGKVVLY